jgi:hypothetical protein
MENRLEVESSVWNARAFGVFWLLCAFAGIVVGLVRGEGGGEAVGFLWVGLFGGVLLLVPPRRKRLVLDVETGAGSLEQRGLLGRRTTVFRLQDVAKVRSFANSFNERVYLHLSDGKSICGYASMKFWVGFRASKETEAVAARIEALTTRRSVPPGD